MLKRSLRCAIVDDDPADILLLKTFIQKATSGTWIFDEHNDYDSAEFALDNNDINIAFIDLNINGRDGLELIKNAVQKNAAFPIVVVSALSDDDLQEAAISAGAYDFLPKDDVDEKTIKRTLRHVFASFKKTQDLQKTADQERYSSSIKSSFLACMSHDLRTPLNAIIGFADVLHTSAIGPRTHEHTKEYTGIIGDSARHLLEIINMILDLSKIEEGKYTMDCKWLNLNEFLHDQIRFLQPISNEKSIFVNLHMTHRDALLLADERALRQIFINIFSNAVKFSDRKSKINILTSLHDGNLVITVSDSGVGMTNAEAKHAVTPFGQVTRNPELARQGTGLGLAIVKGLAEAHDAELKISSRKGIGTRVSITFPPKCVSQQKALPRKVVKISAA